MTRVIGLILLILAVLGAPLWLDAQDADAVADQVAAQSREHAVRVAPRRAAAYERTRAADPYPKLAEGLGLGRPLPATLFAITELATKSGLAAPILTVQPPTPLAREAGEPVLSEHRVRLAARGLPRAVHRFVQTLPDLVAPVRVESAKLTEPTAKDPAAVLTMDLRILVDAQ